VTIVVVDDDSFNLSLLSAILETLGEPIALFDDPRAALENIERLRPVLVITDHLMPHIQGVELIARIRANPAVADVPVLMLTGADELAIRVAAFEVGVTDFASRPIDPTELQARARALSRLGAAQMEMKRQAALLAGQVEVATATLAVQQEEQVRLSQKLRAAEHFEGIAELASGIAHDINNLLTVISGGTESILAAHPADATVLAESHAIMEAVARGSSLTRQVLAYSRRQALRPAAFDAGQEIERNRLMLAHVAGHSANVSLQVPPRRTPIFADRTQFLTGLINLVANARDACSRDARIVVRVTVIADGQVAGMEGPVIGIEVEDNGTGMTSDVAARAFDPFFTTKPRGEGTGLGLSMVHGFVHQSGGTLGLVTTPGVGTRVQMFFPQAAPAAAAAAERPSPAMTNGVVSPSVLVVDDDEAVRRTLARLLQLRGMTVETVGGALAAMQRMSERSFDALLSDVLMPGDFDGLDLARWARLRRLPVLLLSGFVGGELPQDLLDDPRVRLLRKPVDSATLAREVQELVSLAEIEP
jgi:signal transduction histidine kinase